MALSARTCSVVERAQLFLLLTTLFLATSIVAQMTAISDTPAFDDVEHSIADSSFVFDLIDSTPTLVGSGGQTIAATSKTFPAIALGAAQGAGAGQQVLQEFEPCGFRTPHFHPRGTENLFVVQGNLSANFLRSNGSFVSNPVKFGESAFFPQGHFHFVSNPTCQIGKAIAIFGNDDPGAIELSGLLNLPDGILSMTLGVMPLQKLPGPTSLVLLDPACLARCGLSTNATSMGQYS